MWYERSSRVTDSFGGGIRSAYFVLRNQRSGRRARPRPRIASNRRRITITTTNYDVRSVCPSRKKVANERVVQSRDWPSTLAPSDAWEQATVSAKRSQGNSQAVH